MVQRFLLSSLVLLLLNLPAQAANVTLSSLLDEMLDRNAITQFPDPNYTCKQASSYDRASKSPTERWFANADTAQFVREETNGGRKEWVLMDEKGPGAIVRWWITAPHYRTNFRIYIDGKTEPEVLANIGDLIGGKFLVDAPLSAVKANGRNLYLPIPYAKSIKITVDDMPTQRNLYYQINYRTYGDEVNVESFTMQNFRSLMPQVEKVQKTLLESPINESEGYTHQFRLAKNGGRETITETTPTPLSINSLAVKIDAEDIPQAMRSVLVKVSFDGIPAIRVPLSDFFGGGVGINPYQSWYAKVEEDGTLRSFWRMPFKQKIEAAFVNYSDQDITISIRDIDYEPIQWTDRTMYFFADWRQDRMVETFREEEKKEDWNYITLQGKGIFVGDALSIRNDSVDWWGEGDEKIYVDGETFPSHFGTGTEDYYGYAWCTPEVFDAPFHAQPRAEGPGNFGHATNNRWRALDGIPFTKDFRFDMEIWHWAATTIDYSVVTYWYAFPGVQAVDAPTGKYPSDATLIEEVKAKVAYKTPYVFKMPGFEVKEMPNGRLTRQEMSGWRDGTWKDNDQLWWTDTKPGDKLELVVQVEKNGPQKLICEMTKARDYGQFQFYLDGKKVGDIVDLYNSPNVINTGPVVIGTIDVEKGEHVLTIEVVGKNASSAGTMFGLDVYQFE